MQSLTANSEVVLRLAAILTVGTLFGAMLFIGFALTKYWVTLPSDTFRSWFQATGPFIGGVMIPLWIGAMVVTLIAVVASSVSQGHLSSVPLISLTLLLALIPIYLLVHGPANELFASAQPLADLQVRATLQQWIDWHYIRTGLVGVSFLLLALRS